MNEKMKISAVICELNPLHFGHRAILSHARSLGEGVVCILSGNFVQRGEPAVLDKWARTQLALENGADLIVELPLPFACSGAERFAQGGVFLASSLGLAGTLLFGGEEDCLPLLQEISQLLLSPSYTLALQQAEAQSPGQSFAKRRESALLLLHKEGLVSCGKQQLLRLLRSPNCILGLEYCKALSSQQSSLTPSLFLRRGAGHDQFAQGEEFYSASQLRELMHRGESLLGLAPESTCLLLAQLENGGQAPSSISYLERAILCKLRTLSLEDFKHLPDISEGLENRLYTASRKAGSLLELYELCKSKRYSHARIRRLVLSAFLGLHPPYSHPPYLRILGMNQRGEKILKQAVPSLPLLCRRADADKLSLSAQAVYHLEARADDLYALSFKTPLPSGEDYRRRLIKL